MMDDMELAEMELQAAITRALERRPEPTVPAEFAAKVRAALPVARARRRRLPAGRTAAMAAMVLLATGLFAVAPHATSASVMNVGFDLEMLILVELAAVGYCLVGKGRA